jgi:hypothetical protein
MIYKTQLCHNPTECEFEERCTRAHSKDELRSFIPSPRKEKFNLATYRTSACVGFPQDCACDGLNYHTEMERRRDNTASYFPVPCPSIKVHGSWHEPSLIGLKCVQSHHARSSDPWNCMFSHTLMEVMYHPLIYKSKLCRAFEQNGICKFGSQCAHAHGKKEMRTPSTKNHLFETQFQLVIQDQ